MSDMLKSAVTLFIYSKGNNRCVGIQRVTYSPDAVTNTFGRVETWTFAPRKLHTVTKYALCMYPTFVTTPDKYYPTDAEKVACNIIPVVDGIGRLLSVGRDEIICTVCSALKLGSAKKLSISNLSTSTVILSDEESKIDDTNKLSLKRLDLVFKGKITKVFGLDLGTFCDRMWAKSLGVAFDIEIDPKEGVQITGPIDLTDMRAPDWIKRHILNLSLMNDVKFNNIDGITLIESDYIKTLRQRFSNGK